MIILSVGCSGGFRAEPLKRENPREETVVNMKLIRTACLLIAAVIVCSLSSCGEQKKDAGVLLREAKTNADAITSCTASIHNTLEFTADAKKNRFQTGNDIVYQAKPFALKSVQTSLSSGIANSSTTYNITDADGVWFYSQTDGKWQKTSAGSIDPTPFHQVDILRLLDSVKGQSYVRETDLDSGKAHKLELTFDSEVLRSTVENIVTAAGIGRGSNTIVQALLDSAQDIYGYCYIDEKTGEIVQVELDATQEVNRIFQNIDGSNVKIEVTKCVIDGKIGNIGKAPGVKLPPEAAAAQTVQAQG